GDPMPRRFTSSELETLVADAALSTVEIRGIRVFTDHVSSAVVDSDPQAAEGLRRLEAAVCTHPDFMSVATELHLLALKR
ncbi:MAG: SAM-dependent methyltransferase, partial [Nocardioidaceae bacterium]